jgi:hypothetical protein
MKQAQKQQNTGKFSATDLFAPADGNMASGREHDNVARLIGGLSPPQIRRTEPETSVSGDHPIGIRNGRGKGVRDGVVRMPVKAATVISTTAVISRNPRWAPAMPALVREPLSFTDIPRARS